MGCPKSHLQELQKKHTALSAEIDRIQKHEPGRCQTELRALKKQKLALKEEIATIESRCNDPQVTADPAVEKPVFAPTESAQILGFVPDQLSEFEARIERIVQASTGNDRKIAAHG